MIDNVLDGVDKEEQCFLEDSKALTVECVKGRYDLLELLRCLWDGLLC